MQALVGLGLLAATGWSGYTKVRAIKTEGEPWPWPPEFRALAESMARPLDPTPQRILPPSEKTSLIAAVATTKAELDALMSDKPNAWPWALFASVLVQRRNALTDRLRRCVSGYQPRPGQAPLSGRGYSMVALGAISDMSDVVEQIGPFMRSPAFSGAFGEAGADSNADAEAILAVAHRLMDYHESFLRQAETCVQTAVQSEALVFVQDMGAYTLFPLIGYEQFITTMCARVGEVQDVLPYADPTSTVWFDNVTLTMDLPDDLSERTAAHFRRFSQ